MNKIEYAVAVAEYGKKPDTLYLYNTFIDAVNYCSNAVYNPETVIDDTELYIIDIESGTVIYVYRRHKEVEVVDTMKKKIFLTCEELGIDYQALKLLAEGALFDE